MSAATSSTQKIEIISEIGSGTKEAFEMNELRAKLASIDRVQAVAEFDLQGNVLNANETFLRIMDYEISDIRGRHHRMFCETRYTSAPEYKYFWQKLASGEFDAGEYKRIGKNGKEIWIQASYNPVFGLDGKPYKVIKFATDITEAKQKNLESASKLSALDKSFAVIDFRLDGTIISANQNFLKALGYDLQDIKDRHHRIFCTPEYANSHDYKAFWDKLGRGEFDAGEYKRIGKNGKEVWIQASYNPIIDADGRVVRVTKFAVDITAAKMSIINAIEETAHALAGAANELTASATQMASTASKTSQESISAASAAEEVASGVQTVATNTEEMVASIKEIARSANESSLMAKATLANAQSTNRTIAQLGASSQEIGDVIKVISSIAQQTNLLALNATIEAARAGDAGKGFAVVANEVKELAKQTAKATQEITNKIGAIQKDTQSAVDAIAGISEAVDKLNGISGAIAASVEEQTATTNEVSRVVAQSRMGVDSIAATIRTVSNAASESSSASNQTLAASKELATMAERLNGIVRKAK